MKESEIIVSICILITLCLTFIIHKLLFVTVPASKFTSSTKIILLKQVIYYYIQAVLLINYLSIVVGIMSP